MILNFQRQLKIYKTSLFILLSKSRAQLHAHSCGYKHNLQPILMVPYGRKFWRGIYFGGLAVLRAIRQNFIRQKLHGVMSSLLQNHSLLGCSWTRQSNCRHGVYHLKLCTGTSVLQRVLYTEGKSWLVCQREEGDPNNVYAVTTKTDGTKTVQSTRNNDLLSFQLHLIINFVLT